MHLALYIVVVIGSLSLTLLFQMRSLRKWERRGMKVDYKKALELPILLWFSTVLAIGLALLFDRYAWAIMGSWLVFVWALSFGLLMHKKRQRGTGSR
jgi:hypothetical protein